MTEPQKRRTPLAGGVRGKAKQSVRKSTPLEANGDTGIPVSGNTAQQTEERGSVFFTWEDSPGRTHALRRSFGFGSTQVAYTLRPVPTERIDSVLQALGMREPAAAIWQAVAIALALSFRNEPSTPARRAA